MTKRLIFVYILLIPFDNYRILPISLSNLVLCLTLPIFFIESYYGQKRISKSYIRIAAPVYLGIIYVIGLTLFFVFLNPYENFEKLKDVFFHFLILVFLCVSAFTISSNRRYRDYYYLLNALLISSLISTVLGYYDYVHLFIFGEYWKSPELLRINGQLVSPYLIRMTGTYFDPNYFSLIPGIGFSCTLVLIKRTILKKFLIVFFLLALFLTFSRMAYLGIILFGVFRLGNMPIWKWVKQLVLVILPIIIIAALPLTIEKFRAMNQNSIGERMVIIRGAVDLFIERPLFGHGLGTVVESQDFLPGTATYRETHNTFFQVLLYGGTVYFSLLMLPFFYYCYRMIETRMVSAEGQLIRAFVFNVLPFLLLGLTFLSYLNIKYFWIVFFLIMEYVHLYNLNRSENYSSPIGQR